MSETADSGIHPFTQKQEDLLLEIFTQLSIEDRRAVIKHCRDLLKAARENENDG